MSDYSLKVKGGEVDIREVVGVFIRPANNAATFWKVAVLLRSGVEVEVKTYDTGLRYGENYFSRAEELYNAILDRVFDQ